MCGIGGVRYADEARAVSEDRLREMQRRLAHRGPDASGTWTEGPAGLCHTRLSILDLSERGRQPMASPSGRWQISYNGEVYNYRALRRELEACGRRFASRSDTEVILHLVEERGIGGLAALEGMFAIALYDRERRALHLVRDRLGIKPLFWCEDSEGVSFASEPKALPQRADAGKPSPARIAEYLAFRHLAGEESLLPDVRTLVPGHRLETDGRSVRIERWWRPGRAPAPAAAEETGAVVSAAVRRQLVSDVPVGVFLSGGIDSAAVAFDAAAALPSLSTFTVGFEEAGWDESARAKMVADALGTKEHTIRLGQAEYVAGLRRAIWHLDAPLNHAHSVHLLALSRFARERITVALTGEGSDELFAGYPRYRIFLLARRLRALSPSLLRSAARRLRGTRPRWARLLEAGAEDAATAAAINSAFVPIDEAARLAGAADESAVLAPRRALYADARARGEGETEALLSLERSTYLVSLLQRMDRMSMAAGLECRVPLLDEGVLAHALALPLRERIDLRTTKKPVRALAERRFGRAYAFAPKSGFGVPHGEWLRSQGPYASLVERLLGDGRAARRGLFDADAALRLLAEHRSGVRDGTEPLWGLANLELWARVCLDGEGPTA